MNRIAEASALDIQTPVFIDGVRCPKHELTWHWPAIWSTVHLSGNRFRLYADETEIKGREFIDSLSPGSILTWSHPGRPTDRAMHEWSFVISNIKRSFAEQSCIADVSYHPLPAYVKKFLISPGHVSLYSPVWRYALERRAGSGT